MIVRFDFMMSNFESLMNDIMNFLELETSQNLQTVIKDTAEKQRQYVSEHKYDLEKFGITEEQIKNDCKEIYETFLS